MKITLYNLYGLSLSDNCPSHQKPFNEKAYHQYINKTFKRHEKQPFFTFLLNKQRKSSFIQYLEYLFQNETPKSDKIDKLYFEFAIKYSPINLIISVLIHNFIQSFKNIFYFLKTLNLFSFLKLLHLAMDLLLF
jgi:hypothetical protein